MKAGVRKIRDRFTHYLEQVRRGRELIITDRGRSIAVLLPLSASPSIDEAISQLRAEGAIEMPDAWEPLPLTRSRLKGRLLSDLVRKEREEGW